MPLKSGIEGANERVANARPQTTKKARRNRNTYIHTCGKKHEAWDRCDPRFQDFPILQVFRLRMVRPIPLDEATESNGQRCGW